MFEMNKHLTGRARRSPSSLASTAYATRHTRIISTTPQPHSTHDAREGRSNVAGTGCPAEIIAGGRQWDDFIIDEDAGVAYVTTHRDNTIDRVRLKPNGNREGWTVVAGCAEYLFERRWLEGFVCPGCGGGRAWLLKTKAFTYECADCGRQTSVTAGTIMHASKLPLTVWFWAAFLMATHSNGISALQLQNHLALGSYRTAWMLCAKLRRAMVNPEREPLSGLVEADETMIPFRTLARGSAATR